MKKTPKSSQAPVQENLIDSAVEIDFRQLLTDSKLSENEQGIVKRRLIENREPFGKVLQLLARRIKLDVQVFCKPLILKEHVFVFKKSIH